MVAKCLPKISDAEYIFENVLFSDCDLWSFPT